MERPTDRTGRGTARPGWERRLRAAAPAALLALAVLGVPDAARAAVPLDDDSNEAQLMGYYAAALSFTPLGAPAGRRIEAAIDASYLPPLSDEDRQTTFAGAKIENTNFTSVIPRPRIRWRPGDWLLEAAYVPPIELFGVKPQQLAAAAAWRFAAPERGPAWWVRAHYMRADIEGPITCSEDAIEDPDNLVCRGGQVSEDRFRPETYGLDVLVSGPRLGRGGPAWYAMAGYRHERLQFDTHFVNNFDRLDDQVLIARLDRGSVGGGVSWDAWRGLRLNAEAYYAPEALFTGRVAMAWGWGEPR
jgi:hypothetical protein